MDRQELARWEMQFEAHLRSEMNSDAAHDLEHVRRVVRSAEEIAREESGALEVVLPAAWLHDLVRLSKGHPQAEQSSRMSAQAAGVFLEKICYPAPLLPGIAHCIEAHSFSANLNPATLEACIVQDADRLDALGAIGIARCFATSGALGRPFYDEIDPFAQHRRLDDVKFAVDHFERKLFRVAETLNTPAARRRAGSRVELMRIFLKQLRREIAADEATGTTFESSTPPPDRS
jgi:uncharacterized protein